MTNTCRSPASCSSTAAAVATSQVCMLSCLSASRRLVNRMNLSLLANCDHRCQQSRGAQRAGLGDLGHRSYNSILVLAAADGHNLTPGYASIDLMLLEGLYGGERTSQQLCKASVLLGGAERFMLCVPGLKQCSLWQCTIVIRYLVTFNSMR